MKDNIKRIISLVMTFVICLSFSNINQVKVNAEDNSVDFQWGNTFTAFDIANWGTSPAPGKAELDQDNNVVITENRSDEYAYGGIISPSIEVDLNKEPTISVNIVEANPKWYMQIYFEGEQNGYYIQGGTLKTGETVLKINDDIKTYYPEFNKIGIHRIKIALMVEGVEKGSNIVVSKLETNYTKKLKNQNNIQKKNKKSR